MLTLKQALSVLSASLGFTLIGTGVQAFQLTNGPGEGTLSVGVDEFGSFGSAVGGVDGNGDPTTNAFYTPVGSDSDSGTSFESGIAIGMNGLRTFLTSGSIGGSFGGNVTNTITGDSLSADSAFSYQDLDFEVTQTVSPLFDDNTNNQSGSVLTQRYTISNRASNSVAFDLVRYLDGDLAFDGSILDGGGILGSGSDLILFETDSGGSNANTFVGITATGGTVPSSNRFEISSWSGLRSKIISGGSLSDTVQNDFDGDGFIDVGSEFDVTLAMRNQFTLAAGATTTYSTQTIFGAGELGDNTPGSSQNFPLLPTQEEPGVFIFEDVPSGLWFDPPFVNRFDYEIAEDDSDSLFTSIIFPTGFNDSFTLSSGGVVLGEFDGGESFTFDGSGVLEFSISGIDPAVDAALGDAFPLYISFNEATGNNFTMTAVPEPMTILGAGIALGFGSVFKRKVAKK